jgi:hypothetical protein
MALRAQQVGVVLGLHDLLMRGADVIEDPVHMLDHHGRGRDHAGRRRAERGPPLRVDAAVGDHARRADGFHRLGQHIGGGETFGIKLRAGDAVEVEGFLRPVPVAPGLVGADQPRSRALRTRNAKFDGKGGSMARQATGFEIDRDKIHRSVSVGPVGLPSDHRKLPCPARVPDRFHTPRPADRRDRKSFIPTKFIENENQALDNPTCPTDGSAVGSRGNTLISDAPPQMAHACRQAAGIAVMRQEGLKSRRPGGLDRSDQRAGPSCAGRGIIPTRSCRAACWCSHRPRG